MRLRIITVRKKDENWSFSILEQNHQVRPPNFYQEDDHPQLVAQVGPEKHHMISEYLRLKLMSLRELLLTLKNSKVQMIPEVLFKQVVLGLRFSHIGNYSISSGLVGVEQRVALGNHVSVFLSLLAPFSLVVVLSSSFKFQVLFQPFSFPCIKRSESYFHQYKNG